MRNLIAGNGALNVVLQPTCGPSKTLAFTGALIDLPTIGFGPYILHAPFTG